MSKIQKLQAAADKAKKKPEPAPSTGLLGDMPASDWIPDAFPVAQQESITRSTDMAPGGQTTPPSRLNFLSGVPPQGKIELSPPVPGNDDNHVAAHEAGHAIFMNDLTPEEKQKWARLHTISLQNVQPSSSLFKYRGDPSHSFAEAYGMFAAQPEQLKAQFPQLYNFIRDTSGFEYSRKLKGD